MNTEESHWPALAHKWLEGRAPRFALILGSGMGVLAEAIEDPLLLGYAAVPGLPVSRVPGHAGKFLSGTLNGLPVVVACGRVHAYEGHPPAALGAHVRFLAACGITTLLLTNAAGSLDPGMRPGEWMLVTDHINLLGFSPLEGSPCFLDMTSGYDEALREAIREVAARLEICLHTGVYAAVRGPQYETPAEVRMLKMLGARAVGMSTVPEVIQGRMLGLRVAALSCITNFAAGISNTPPSHEEVLDTGRRAASQCLALLKALVQDPRLKNAL